MNKCCNVSNPLRRDGTSQKQRFARALAESYVQIDERSHADILNFTLGLSKGINYYDNTNQIDGTTGWLDFFKSDASFVLADLYLLDIEAYKLEFSNRLAAVQEFYDFDPVDFELRNQLGRLFEYFLIDFASPFSAQASLTAFPRLLDTLIDTLPDSSLFADERAFSFRDLVRDSRKRLVTVIKKVNLAHQEATYSYFDMTSDIGGWLLLKPEWNVVPIAPPAPAFVYSYFNSQPTADVPKVLELLQLCHDTFVGILENLKGQIPIYLEQSLGKYPWHAPQNGLFLAFMQLFDYAKLHINRLGRKHLLYYYEDVLRFSAQAAVPDQAALIFQLRKGVTRHLIEAGTLLKAGKDPDGKALFYEVPEENVLNQAAVKALKSVYVERTHAPLVPASTPITGADPTASKPQPVARVLNIYASPIANSADGLGAELDKEEPKWNMFGEPQSVLAADSRTMPDANIGFAVASPLFVMHEGYREVFMTFVVSTAFPGIGEYVLPTDRHHIAAREFAILDGLRAEYTTEKGWADATITQVFLTTSEIQLGLYRAADSTAVIEKPAGWSFASGFLLSFRLLIEEDSKACLAYNEAVHAAGMNTAWPVIRLTLTGQSRSALSLGLHALITDQEHEDKRLWLFGGQIYKYPRAFEYRSQGNDNKAPIPNPTSLVGGGLILVTWEEALNLKYPVYDPNKSYPANGSRVIYDSVAYDLIKDYAPPATVTVFSPLPEYWKEADFSDYIYDYLQYFLPSQVMLRVDVSSFTGVLLENDAAKLKPNKPFNPFGAVPTIGSRFYIGSQEILGKKLDKLTINLEWQDMPLSLPNYFQKYMPLTSPPATNALWVANATMLIDGKWTSLGSKPLFAPNNAGSAHKIEFTNLSFARDLSLVEPTKLETTSTRGFLRLELAAPSIGFGHKHYRDLYVKEAYRAAAAIANKPATSPPPSIEPSFPNEPISPTIKDFSISYSSRASIDFGPKSADATSFDSRIEQFFHIQPFGQTEEHPYLWKTEASRMVPKLPDEGYLYMGIEDLEPPSTLSLLYQLVEGSGNADLELHTPKWSYLTKNKWVDLGAKDILTDTTVGMITSGVQRYDLDTEMSTGNTLLDSNLHWMRAKVDANVPANLKAISILAQAVVVKFKDQKNNLAHLATSLPKGTINGLFINDPVVKKVDQPYSSTGGKLPEQSDAYLTRVSERLRHKQRSINVWDYERMVLEQFPEIYKVKCLNHTALQVSELGGADWEISPGHVTIICIPDLRNRNAVNPFEPKTSVHTLKGVTTYLSNYVSTWVDLKVANPLYEQLKISCKIGFVLGKDPGYYIGQLEIAIQQFLSPWAFEQGEEIVFGNSIHRSQIIRFIEQQDYVDYVISFRMDHIKGAEIEENVAEARAATGRSIIVSALRHEISSGDATCADCEVIEEVIESTGNCCTTT